MKLENMIYGGSWCKQKFLCFLLVTPQLSNLSIAKALAVYKVLICHLQTFNASVGELIMQDTT